MSNRQSLHTVDLPPVCDHPKVTLTQGYERQSLQMVAYDQPKMMIRIGTNGEYEGRLLQRTDYDQHKVILTAGHKRQSLQVENPLRVHGQHKVVPMVGCKRQLMVVDLALVIIGYIQGSSRMMTNNLLGSMEFLMETTTMELTPAQVALQRGIRTMCRHNQSLVVHRVRHRCPPQGLLLGLHRPVPMRCPLGLR